MRTDVETKEFTQIPFKTQIRTSLNETTADEVNNHCSLFQTNCSYGYIFYLLICQVIYTYLLSEVQSYTCLLYTSPYTWFRQKLFSVALLIIVLDT